MNPGGWKRSLAALTIFALLFWAFPQGLVFLFPGLFVLFSGHPFLNDENDFLKTLLWICLFSFSFWILSYWVTFMVPVKLSRLFYAANGFFIILFALKSYAKAPRLPVKGGREQAILLVLFLFIAAARFVPFFNRIAGSVGDMTQHNYMTRLIIFNDGFNPSYEPVMPFSGFGEYPPGFHTLSALIAQAGNYPYHRVTVFLGCCAYVLLHLGLYAFLSRFVTRTTALAASAFVLFLSHYPQFLNQWGSSTTALSAAFLFAAWPLLLESEYTWTEKTAVAALLAGGPLCHLVVPVGFLAYFGIYFILDFYFRKRSAGAVLRGLLPVLLLSLLFLSPFLKNFNFGTYGQARETIVSGHEASVEKIFTPFSRLPQNDFKVFWEGGVVFAFILGPAFSVLIFALWLSALDKAEKQDLFSSTDVLDACGQLTAAAVLFAVLFALFRLRAVPFYALLQVERIHYFVLFPAATVAAYAGSLFFYGWKPAAKSVLGLAFCGLLLWNGSDLGRNNFESHYTAFKDDKNLVSFLFRDALWGSYFAYAFDRTNASITEADLRAFEWIRQNTEPGALFLTNYGDGGNLITSLAERRTWSPHGMDLWHARELKDWQAENAPSHVYVGEKDNPRYPAQYPREVLDARPGQFVKIYGQEGASVYKMNHE